MRNVLGGATSLDFVIVGAQKGGSTALASALRQHPQISMPKDEIPTFRDPVFTTDRVSSLLLELSRRTPTAARGIKCPDYLGRPEVPQRLHDLAGAPRILACLRNPVSRAISTYYWHVRWGLLPVEDPSIGLEKVMAGEYAGVDPTAQDILDWGMYATMLRRYFDVFSQDRVCVLMSEEVRRAPEVAYKGVYTFLGVDSGFTPSLSTRAANEGVYAPVRLRFGRLRNRYLLKWDADQSYPSIPPARRGWPAVFSRSVAAADRYVLRPLVSNEPPTLSNSVQDRLRAYYRDDISDLEDLLGRRIPAWR